MTPQLAPYGTWSSPVSAQLLVTDAVSLSAPSADGDAIYWVEGRPSEGGRNVLVRRSAAGVVEDVVPEGFAVRTLAHEYGGRCAVVHDSVAYFSNFADQRLYQVAPGDVPVAITPEPPSERAWRYADPIVTADGRHLICVWERHEASQVDNNLVVLPTDGGAAPRVLAQGHDFFAAPTLSPDGRSLAWVAWDHPQMPWDGTELCEALLSETLEITSIRVVAGGMTEAVQEPRYGADGSLFFISDRTGWWNLYLDAPDGPVPLAPRDAEFAQPAWLFGVASYAPRANGSLAVTWTEGGQMHLGTVAAGHELVEVPVAATALGRLSIAGDQVLAIAGSPTAPLGVVAIDVSSGECAVLKQSRQLTIDATYVSVPEAIEFPTEHGLTAFGLYYAPTNPDFVAPAGSLPPLIVASHGGPTGSCSSPVLDYEIQFWTSRGIAVVDVDYGGSTGYGRAYRERLKGNWGVVDLDDCVNAAKFCVATGRANPEGLLIHGWSAGGYTTLCALTFRDVFAAGASYFGVGDLGALARDTHKFESRYLDGLVGPWPERQDLYEERSPIFHTDLLSTPVILFQGLEDEVVPPAQAEAMVAALRAKGVPFAYVAYEGEQHGFRKAESIIRSAEAELSFYGQVLGFEPAGVLTPVEIVRVESA